MISTIFEQRSARCGGPCWGAALFTNGQVGTSSMELPENTGTVKSFFSRGAVLAAAKMNLSDIVRLTVFLTDKESKNFRPGPVTGHG